MKSYWRDRFTIRFVKEISTENSGEIALQISTKLEYLANTCDNKISAEFPVNAMEEVVKLCNNLEDEVPNYNVPEAYIDYVRENKEALGYFQESRKEVSNEEERIIKKRKNFRLFKSKLEELKNTKDENMFQE